MRLEGEWPDAYERAVLDIPILPDDCAFKILNRERNDLLLLRMCKSKIKSLDRIDQYRLPIDDLILAGHASMGSLKQRGWHKRNRDALAIPEDCDSRTRT